MYHTNCDDAQTDQNRVRSYFPQVNILGKQSKSQKILLCGARDVPNAQADLSLGHSHVLQVSLLLVHVSSYNTVLQTFAASHPLAKSR